MQQPVDPNALLTCLKDGARYTHLSQSDEPPHEQSVLSESDEKCLAKFIWALRGGAAGLFVYRGPAQWKFMYRSDSKRELRLALLDMLRELDKE